MSDTKFAPAMFELLGKAMDEVAREFGAMDQTTRNADLCSRSFPR
jgi:hypothetical protein